MAKKRKQKNYEYEEDYEEESIWSHPVMRQVIAGLILAVLAVSMFYFLPWWFEVAG